MKFRKPLNMLEGEKRQNKALEKAVEEDKNFVVCESCKKRLKTEELNKNWFVCSYCGNHFRIGARDRIFRLADVSSFCEMFDDLRSFNILGFEGYDKKLASARESGEEEAVITGVGSINGNKTAIFAMEPNFMMGSMGSTVGERITRLFEYAIKERLPVVGFSVSGGARMQEGILSLMQMAKTSGAVKKHSLEGLFFLSILTNPTTGGVTASFASLGDIIIAEPGALIGFAGPRVIEQTIRKKLPVGFQRAEFIIQKGFIDAIVERTQQKEFISELLKMHSDKKQTAAGKAVKETVKEKPKETLNETVITPKDETKEYVVAVLEQPERITANALVARPASPKARTKSKLAGARNTDRPASGTKAQQLTKEAISREITKEAVVNGSNGSN